MDVEKIIIDKICDYSPVAFCQGASKGFNPTACNPKLSMFNAAFSSLSSDSSQQGHL